MKSKVTMEECDNPECDYSEIVSDDEPATGYHFGSGRSLKSWAGVWALGGGGPIPAFYAHRKECIVPALEAAMDRDRR